MPLYEYQCDACGRRFEKIQKFSDPPIEVCPTCGGHVQKLVSSPAFQFKGTGWYITDYSRKDKGGTSEGEKGSGTAAAAPSDAGDKGAKTTTESSGSSSGSEAKSTPAPAKDAAPASSTTKS